MIIAFNPEDHTYTLDGRIVPGITAIGESLNLIEGVEFMPEEKKRFGQYVHEAIELDLRGMLDEASCPALMPYVEAARLALEDLGIAVKPDQVEVLVGNPGLGYATQIDFIGTHLAPLPTGALDVRGDGMDTVCVNGNWKTGIPMWFHRLQAAAERLCLPGTGWKSVAIYLHPDEPGKDGKPYSAVWHDDPRDEALWRAACELYDAKYKANQSVRPRKPRGKKDAEESTVSEEVVPLPDRSGENLFAEKKER